MTGATFLDAEAIVPGRVAAYALDGDGQLRRDRRLEVDFGPLYNDLGMTIGDFARWLVALGDDRVLSRASREAMWTPARLAEGRGDSEAWREVWQWQRYGLGFGLDEIAGRRIVTHSGSSGVGFVYLPDERFGAAVFTNLAHSSGSDPIGLALGVAGRLRPELDLAARPPVADPDPARSARLRAVYESLLRGEPDLAAFAPGERAAAWEGAGSLSGRAGRLGELAGLVYLGEDPSSEGARLVYRADHERGRVVLRVAFDDAGGLRTFVWSRP
jgi:CubicO group peptidase (beta-lactamase class C family)